MRGDAETTYVKPCIHGADANLAHPRRRGYSPARERHTCVAEGDGDAQGHDLHDASGMEIGPVHQPGDHAARGTHESQPGREARFEPREYCIPESIRAPVPVVVLPWGPGERRRGTLGIPAQEEEAFLVDDTLAVWVQESVGIENFAAGDLCDRREFLRTLIKR